MTLLDGIVVLVLAVSVIRSLTRGLVEEVFSLAAWVVALLGAKWAAPTLAAMLPIAFGHERLRYLAGMVVAFVALLITVMLVGHLAKGWVGAVGLGVADRLVGGVFGVLRGLVILVGLTLAAGLTSLPQTDFWKHAAYSGPLESFAKATRPLLPAELAKHIRYG